MNKIKNLSNSTILINLPNVRYRTEIRPKQERTLSDEILMEFTYDAGCANMVKWGFLKVFYDENTTVDRIDAPDTKETDVATLLTKGTIKQLSDTLKTASPALKDEIVETATKLSIVDEGRCNIIKKYTNVDVLNVLAMSRKE